MALPRTALTFLLVCFSSQVALGEVIYVDFHVPNGGGDPNNPINSPTGTWNTIVSADKATGKSDLVDFNTGLGTGVDLLPLPLNGGISPGPFWASDKDWVVRAAGGDAFISSFDISVTFDDLTAASYVIEVVSSGDPKFHSDITINGAFADGNFNGTSGVDGDDFNAETDGQDPQNWLIWNSVAPVNGMVTVLLSPNPIPPPHQTNVNFTFLNAVRIRSAGSVFPQGEGVPEPATLTLWSLGALAFAGYGWRRRKRAA